MNSAWTSGPEKDDRVMPQERTQSIIQQLVLLCYECANCLGIIRHNVAVWSCNDCHRIFHLYCIKKWAKQSESGIGLSFRCPHCQATQSSSSRYFCFCGKVRDPPYDPHIVPHSCGQTCGKERRLCPHPCPLQCHPGPCVECSAVAGPQACPCGATTYTWRCGYQDPRNTCGGVCAKLLSCGVHTCKQACHWGTCETCSERIRISCHCLSEARDMPCGSMPFSCGKECGKKLQCGIHFCPLSCHAGPCPSCEEDPSIVLTCPCGKVPLTMTRTHCSDPIPTCGNVCGRVLDCGRHTCQNLCHQGACHPCRLQKPTKCVCKMTERSAPCREEGGFRCDKVCKTKLSCGRHECRSICCPDRKNPKGSRHVCDRLCQKKISCGHECLELCHRGLCPPCVHVISERLSCRCGTEVLMPPQPCGTAPPNCTRLCTIPPFCNHPPTKHSCHYGDCPPCMFPVERQCAGGHTIVGNVPCSAKFVSCHAKCSKKMSCGHQCLRPCHSGPCVDKDHPCLQICGKIYNACGHACKKKCHPSTGCPSCAEAVERRCECGRQVQRVLCEKFLRQLNEFPDETLELLCNADCLFEQRLQLLASRVKKAPSPRVKYSLFLWDMALRNLDLVRSIEEQLGGFVASNTSFSCLKAMPAERRALVHSLCHYYHIRSESVDHEPNRSCLLTRTPKTRLPALLLSTAISAPERHSPLVFIKEVCDREELIPSRVIVMKGESINAISVSHVLQDFAGDFVCETEAVCSDLVKQLRVFFTHQTKQQQAYTHLRRINPPFKFFIPLVPNEQRLNSVKLPVSNSWAQLVSSTTKKKEGNTV